MKINFFTRFALKNPTVIFLFIGIIIAGGIYSALNLRSELMPNISVPVVTVSTVYPGASPKDVLENVNKPLEKSISGVKGVKKVTSIANENFSLIVGEFDYSADMDKAERDVQEAVNKVTLPEQVVTPKVGQISFGSAPILIYSISAGVDQKNIDSIVNDKIKPAIEGIDGISSVAVTGLSDNNVYINIDPDKLKEKNLTLDNVKQALQANNISFPTGEVNLNNDTLPVRVSKKLNNLEDIKNIPIIAQPNINASLGEAFASLGQGMGQLGQGLGQLGQQMGILGQSVGNTTQGTVLLALIQQTQSDINKQMMIINNPASTPANKAAAQGLLIKDQRMSMGYQFALNDWINKVKSAIPKGQNRGQTALKSSSTQKISSSKKLSSEPVLNIIHLKDIAKVTTGKEKPTAYSRVNGSPALIMSIQKTDDGNTLEIAKAVSDKLTEVKTTIPNDVKYNLIIDQSNDIKNSVNGMLREGLLGAFFAVLIIALFLRNTRATIVAIVSIPLSMLITLMVLPKFNITINMMSLAGMTIAIGRVVDDSIVVIENIYRRLQNQDEYQGKELVAMASQEVASAITSSTITTVAVFLPLGLVSGMIGKIFAPFAITVVVSILASLLVAVTVVPMLSKLMLMNKKIKEEREGFLQRYYRRLLAWSLHHRWVIVVISVVMLALSIGLVSKVGVQFMPQDNARTLNVKMTMKPGTSLEVTNKVATEFEKMVLSTPGIKTIQSTVGSTNQISGMGANIQGSDGATYLVLIKHEANVDKVTNELRQKVKKLEVNGTLFNISTQSRSGANEQVDIIVKGDNLHDIRSASKKIEDVLKNMPDLANVTNNLSDEKPELAIDVNTDKAADKGFNPIMVAGIIRSMITESEATTIDQDGKTVSVMISLDHDSLNNINKISNLEVNGMKGTVKLKDIATIEQVNGPVSISQLDGNQYASIKGDVTSKDTQKTSKDALAKIDNIKNTLPKGITYELSGSSEQIKESFTQMALAIIVAIVMVYVVMVIAFGEAIAPFSILFALPFAAVGGLIGLFISQQPVSMSALIGMLMLIGIVVTNAIVLVDRVQQNRNKGMSSNEALIEAGVIRLRPILMTAVATIMALMPLAAGVSEGALISVGLGVVVIGGLALSTLLTLVVVPVAFSYLDQLRSKILGIKNKEKSQSI